MLITIARGKNGKPPTLTCVRADGSSTWQRSSDFFAHHDLIHYAVESVLGYREGFLGLVASGRDLDSFGTRDGVKDTYTLEEGWAEAVVGVFHIELNQVEREMSDEELKTVLDESCQAMGAPPPPV